MGWVAIAVIAILAGFTLIGMKRGFVSVVVGLASLVIAFAGASILSEPVGNFLNEKTGLKESITEKVTEFVSEQIDTAKKQAMESVGVKDEKELKSSDFMKKVDGLSLPDDVKKIITDAANSNVSDISKGVVKKAAEELAVKVINAIAFASCFIIILIALIVVRVALKLVTKLPVLNQLNGLLGAVLGFAEGIAVVWIFFAVITANVGQDWAQAALSQVSENKWLSMLYVLNPIIKLL